MKKILIVTFMLLHSVSAQAGVVGEMLSSDLNDEELELVTIYNTDYVHNFIKNNPQCGQNQSVQKFEYDKFGSPGCVNLGVNLLTVFTFDEAIKSYVISQPEEDTNSFFQADVWISSVDAEDNSFINQKTYYIKALYPNKTANIIFLAKSGRQYYFNLKSIDINSTETPTAKVFSILPDKLLTQVKQQEQTQKEQNESYLIESAKKINFEQDNAFQKYMEKLFEGRINTNYKYESYKNGASIRPFAVFDNGSRTFFNFDGIMSASDRPTIAKVLNGIDIPVQSKDAFLLSPDYKGWVYVDTISQEGFTLKLGQGKNAKLLCVKATVNLREFHNKDKNYKEFKANKTEIPFPTVELNLEELN